MSNLQEMVQQLAAIEIYLEEQELALKPAKEAAKNLRLAVQAMMNEVGTDSAKTPDGYRVILVTNTSARVVDGEAFFDFVADTGDFAFMPKRANLEAVLAYIAQNNEPPPGLEINTVNTLRFSRSKQ